MFRYSIIISAVFFATIALAFTIPSCARNAKCSIMPVELTVEYLSSATGLDAKQPRFSWILNPTNENAYGQKQTAYKIIVASS